MSKATDVKQHAINRLDLLHKEYKVHLTEKWGASDKRRIGVLRDGDRKCQKHAQFGA